MNRRTVIVATTTLTSGGLFWLGTGLSPHPWATVLAVLPVLLASRRLGWRASALVAGLAWLLGTTNQWAYLFHELEMPVPALAAFTVGTSVLFAAAVSLWRLVVAANPLLATVALPASWTAVEYVASLLTPHGAYWSLSYTATDIAWLRHLASLTGPWGITFVLLLPAAAIAATITAGAGDGGSPVVGSGPGISRRRRAVPLFVTVGIAVLVAGYGLWPVAADGPTVRVGLVSVAQPEDAVAIETPAGSALLRSYVDAVESLAGRGAQVIVAPEKVFAVTTDELSTVVQPLTDLAARHRVTIVIGLSLHDTGSSPDTDSSRDTGSVRDTGEPVGANLSAGPATTAALYNVALAITGTNVVRYEKHHLIPGLEADFRPGTNLAFVDGYALTVCKDMDFPSLMRDLGDTGLVLAPAWDFDVDNWSHSRMAILRGVESGFSVARAARSGALTASDSRGRVRAEVTGGTAANTTTVLADLPTTPVTTPYERLPDAFAWLCLAILVVASLQPMRHRRANVGVSWRVDHRFRVGKSPRST